MPMPKRSIVLVTGAAGFVGQHVCSALLRSGFRVRALTRSNAATLKNGVQMVPASDITDLEAIERAAEGCVGAVHLAARVHILRKTAIESASLYHRINVGGTHTVAEACRRQGVERLVVLSSIAARRFDQMAPEARSAAGRGDPYGLSKKESEEVLASCAPARTVVLRPPGIYGPGMKGNLPRLFHLVDRGLPIPVPFRSNRRPLLFVGTLAGVISTIVQSAQPGVDVFELADEEVLSTEALVRRIATSLGKRARTVRVPELPMRAVGRLGDLLPKGLRLPLNSRSIDLLFGTLAVDSGPLLNRYSLPTPSDPDRAWSETAAWFRATSST